MKLDSMCIALRAGFGKILEEFDQPENLHSRDRFELKEDILIFSLTARP